MTTPSERAAALEVTGEAFTELDDALAEIERLQAIIDAGPDPMPAALCYVGACPSSSGGKPVDVVNKYGPPVALRTFTGGGFAAPPPRPEGVDRWHQSWKPPLGTLPDTAAVVTALANCRDDDLVTVWHETDVKYRNGSFTRAQADQAIELSTWFEAICASLAGLGDIARVVPVDVYAAWMFDPASGLYPGTPDDPRTAAYYLTRHTSAIGIDCDAYSSTTRYPDFTGVVRNTLEAVEQYGRPGWTVPEWIHPRIQGDTDGTGRAAWLRDQGAMFLEAQPRPLALMLFDTDYSGRVQTIQPDTPEMAAVEALMIDGRLPAPDPAAVPAVGAPLGTWLRWFARQLQLPRP